MYSIFKGFPLIFLVAALLHAATPSTVSWQGFLTDGSGNPLKDSTWTFTFTLYDEANNQVWQEQQEKKTSRGLIAVNLGEVTGLGSVPFDKPYFLGIKVGTAQELPKVQLNTVPYALNASKSDTAKVVMFPQKRLSFTGGAVGDSLRLSGYVALGGDPDPFLKLKVYSSGYFVDTRSDSSIVGLKLNNLSATTPYDPVRTGIEFWNASNLDGRIYTTRASRMYIDGGKSKSKLNINTSVGIGGDPDASAMLKVFWGGSGATPPSQTRSLVVETNSDADGISLLQMANKSLRVTFGSPADNDEGFITYNTSTADPAMFFGVGGSERLRIRSSGILEQRFGLINASTSSRWFDMYCKTADGSDTMALRIGGGGDVSSDRGAFITLYGNERSDGLGGIVLTAGSSGATRITSRVGIGSDADASAVLRIDGASGATDILKVNSAGTHSGLVVTSDNIVKGFLWYNDTHGYFAVGPGSEDNSVLFKDGKFGIGGLPDASAMLKVTGDVYITGALTALDGAWSASDLRLKKNITPLDSTLTKISRLNGISFDWRTEEYPSRDLPESRQIGLIAQEVEQVLPELVRTDTEGYKSLSYDKLTAVLIEAVKEQQKIIETQKQELARLAEKDREQDRILEDLRRVVGN